MAKDGEGRTKGRAGKDSQGNIIKNPVFNKKSVEKQRFAGFESFSAPLTSGEDFFKNSGNSAPQPWRRHGAAMVPPWRRHGAAMAPPWLRGVVGVEFFKNSAPLGSGVNFLKNSKKFSTPAMVPPMAPLWRRGAAQAGVGDVGVWRI